MCWVPDPGTEPEHEVFFPGAAETPPPGGRLLCARVMNSPEEYRSYVRSTGVDVSPDTMGASPPGCNTKARPMNLGRAFDYAASRDARLWLESTPHLITDSRCSLPEFLAEPPPDILCL
jgi:hypothetical protein